MNLLILTTETEHHKFFLNNLRVKDEELNVVYEKKSSSIFKSRKKLLKKKDQIEKILFSNHKYKRNFNANYFISINSISCVKFINKLNPNLIILFGTGILKKKFINKIKCKLLFNLHGGNPQFYRGLDTLFWTIYHNDFSNLFSTLHKVSVRVDTGDILKMKKIKITKKLNFFNIGYYNTKNCISLVNTLIEKKKK